MGSCLSRCIVNDIGNEFEAELDDDRGYRQPPDSTHASGGGAAHAPASGASAFGGTALLAADEVVCLSVLGEGPSGVIYKGSYRGSVVAVKKMRMVAKPAAREVVESALELEAARMGSLRHPNTVLFMGACLQGDYFCIVSEYCHLGSLYDVLRSRHEAAATNSSLGRRKRRAPPPASEPIAAALDAASVSVSASANANNATSSNTNNATSSNHRPTHKRPTSSNQFHSSDGKTSAFSSSEGKKHHRRAIKWIYRIRVAKSAAQGLLYLHSADPPLVHGMLKSTNIVVDDSWNAKIADFGTRRVAEAVGFDRRRMDNVDVETGLLRWAAPELLRLGEDRVLKGQFPTNSAFPQAVDIYSFGIIMWELTTGELPFAQFTTNREIREHVCNGSRPPLGSDVCSVKWAELITRCWSANPARRPTAAEIVAVLEKIYDEEVQAKSQKKKKKVINSNRVDYTYAPDKKPTKGSKFASNVRLPHE